LNARGVINFDIKENAWRKGVARREVIFNIARTSNIFSPVIARRGKMQSVALVRRYGAPKQQKRKNSAPPAKSL
jgi:hypothetical protein